MISTSERAYSMVHHDGNVNGDTPMLRRFSGSLSSDKYRMKPLRGRIRNQAWTLPASNMRTSSALSSAGTSPAFRTIGSTAVGVGKQAKMRSQSQAKWLWFDWMKEELLRHECTA